jgi:hypothetical protein
VTFRSIAFGFGLAACSASRTPRTTPLTAQYCEMALAVLHAVVRSHGEQPLGLEAACVKARAVAAGKVYVDARFSDGHDLEAVPERSCTRDDFVIRFDYQNFERSPSAEVVLLLVDAPTPGGRAFHVQMEEADWPVKKAKSGMVALSQCRSAVGLLQPSGKRWTALVTAPPRDPDSL